MRLALQTIRPWVLGACLLVPGVARAAPVDPSFSETLQVTGLSLATGMAWAPDASRRLFITRQRGEVRIIENGVLVPTPFATISPLVILAECGVIGIAFDPDFANNHFVYFFVTVSETEQQIIRYTANGNVGSDKTTVVSGLATRGWTHNGGGIGFGPDGKMYIAVGDHNRWFLDSPAPANGEADLSSSAAKVLRVNRDGTVPDDNPFFDGPGPNEDRIWARGLRNPFTLTFEPSTDLLWVNLVGSNYEQVLNVRKGDNVGWIHLENRQPQGYTQPLIAYRTSTWDTYPLAGGTRTNGVTTFKTTTPHMLRRGNQIAANGLEASFNERGYVSAIPSPTEVSIPQAGPDATVTGGELRSISVGGAVTGGAFWDSSGVPAAYRDDFYIGDYPYGHIYRVDRAAPDVVTALRDFSSGPIQGAIDVSVGPDGDLYGLQYSGDVKRISYKFSEQALVVSRLHVRALEGGGAAFHVRLAMAPTAPVSVSIAHSAGDADVSVKAGTSLSFDATNWATPQPVELQAAQDADSTEDTATLAVSSAGLATENVVVRVTDEDPLSIVLSATSVSIDEGGTGSFEVSLSGPPPGSVVVNVERSSGSSDVTVAQGSQLSFDASSFSTPQSVGLAAVLDDDQVDDAATISITGNRMETRELTVNVREVQAPRITTSPVTNAIVGSPYAYDVDATAVPAAKFALGQAPPGMTIEAVSGLVSWTPSARGSFDVTVRATNGVAPDATQTFAIAVAGDPSRPGATGATRADDSEGGCGCRTDAPERSKAPLAMLLAAVLLASRRQRRARALGGDA